MAAPIEFESGPDPRPFIHRLDAEDAFSREAAALSLGEIGSPRAARPLAGLLLREVKAIERSGLLPHGEVVRAVCLAIRRIGASEALYALIRALVALVRAKRVDEAVVEEIVESLAEVGGPGAVREASDKVVSAVRAGAVEPVGLEAVVGVLFERLSLCGDSALYSLRRIARGGPKPLQPAAQSVIRRV